MPTLVKKNIIEKSFTCKKVLMSNHLQTDGDGRPLFSTMQINQVEVMLLCFQECDFLANCSLIVMQSYKC